jgi:hypothetical protein
VPLGEDVRRPGQENHERTRISTEFDASLLCDGPQAQFVVANDRPIVITGRATPFQNYGLPLDRRFEFHFGVSAAM